MGNRAVNLKSVSTRDLLEELKSREGVEAIKVSPYEDYTIEVELDDDINGSGPAIILVVTD